MADHIHLEGLHVVTCHGVLEFEKRIPQPFVIDVDLQVDLQDAGRRDDLSASISYADVASRVVSVATQTVFDLIEALAEAIADACLEWPSVEAVAVRVRKPHAPAGVAFTGAAGGPSVSIERERRRQVVIALGTNLGRRMSMLRAACSALREIEGLSVRAVSPVVETDPVGGPDQPDYLNAVVTGVTRLSPGHLLRELHAIEDDLGRVRETRWGARVIDLDLIAMGQAGQSDEVRCGGVDAGAAGQMTSPLALPHPRAHERAFVILPWLEVQPGASIRTPDGVRPLFEVAEALGRDGVRPGPDWELS